MHVLQRSPNLTSVALPYGRCVQLTDLTSVLGLPGRLRQLLHLRISDAPGQVQALHQCTGLAHLDMGFGDRFSKQEALVLAAALRAMPGLTRQDSDTPWTINRGAAALTATLQACHLLVHLRTANLFDSSHGSFLRGAGPHAVCRAWPAHIGGHQH